MAGTESAMDNMIGQLGDKRFMIFRYTKRVGWMIRRKECVEKTVESAFAYETDVANLHGTIRPRRTGFPQSVSVRRIFVC
jgi:hypothetical protein